MIKLLAGYLRPDSGEIIIDGQKLTEVKLTDYYRHIGYLTQEPSVFDGTIWENLTYALDMDKTVIARAEGSPLGGRNEAIHSESNTQDLDCHVVVPPSRNDDILFISFALVRIAPDLAYVYCI